MFCKVSHHRAFVAFPPCRARAHHSTLEARPTAQPPAPHPSPRAPHTGAPRQARSPQRDHQGPGLLTGGASPAPGPPPPRAQVPERPAAGEEPGGARGGEALSPAASRPRSRRRSRLGGPAAPPRPRCPSARPGTHILTPFALPPPLSVAAAASSRCGGCCCGCCCGGGCCCCGGGWPAMAASSAPRCSTAAAASGLSFSAISWPGRGPATVGLKTARSASASPRRAGQVSRERGLRRGRGRTGGLRRCHGDGSQARPARPGRAFPCGNLRYPAGASALPLCA